MKNTTAGEAMAGNIKGQKVFVKWILYMNW